ncbi:unnamed protein product [Strongylus vulgaris]|uniref:Uncharacterized protein n=1 Tax=Strongylus vulgaris TaxID=40348 RepID=A0A3P7KMP3_STRVU|nr:unnamed protein product [Strongylus vulgaris]
MHNQALGLHLHNRGGARSNKLQIPSRITQTYPSKADKYVQTGNRVYDQPGKQDDDEEYDEEDESEEDEEGVEYDEAGNRIVPPSTKRYIYTVFD